MIDTLELVIVEQGENIYSKLHRKEGEEFNIVGVTNDKSELLDLLLKKKPSLAIIDIRFFDEKFIYSLKKQNILTEIIIVASNCEFIEKALSRNLPIIDYITCPFNLQRLEFGIKKAKKIIQFKNENNNNRSTLCVKKYTTTYFIPIDEILFIEKSNLKCIVHTLEKEFEMNCTLEFLEQRLEQSFYKTHRSFICNLKSIYKIKSIGNSYIVYFYGYKKTALVSKHRIKKLFQLINQI